MAQALVTVICPLALDRVAEAEQAIERLENPARADLAAALDRLDPDGGGTHFSSLHAIRSADGARAYLVLEMSADGTDEAALHRLALILGDDLRRVLTLASDWIDGRDLKGYLLAHRVTVGGGWFDTPGAVFSGTPGKTVGDIRLEAALAAKITGFLAEQDGGLRAQQRLADIRARLAVDPAFLGVLDAATSGAAFVQESPLSIAGAFALSFIRTYLWPVVLLVLACGVATGLKAAAIAHGSWHTIGAFLAGALHGVWSAGWVGLLAVLIVLLLAYVRLRRAEARDFLDERTIDPATNAAIFARENRLAQNHMISVTQRKPGLLRLFTSRLIFWAVGQLVLHVNKPGFLNNIGTIHFARWVTPPGSPDVIFLSNYDGSWESYLEDFITRAHTGLTGVWSNSIGFPRSENLIFKGATDGERFKRYARHSMVPSRFWYSAYPDLTTTEIRANAEIRRGLSGAMTEDEAIRWLALFGSAARPAAKLVSSDIQSLLFGGLGFMPFGVCLLVELPEDIVRARAWLAALFPSIAFNDGHRLGQPAVVTLGLGPRGLTRLGLPADGLATFPFTFREGMTTPARSRILGDLGDSAPEHWRWGHTPADAVLLVYGTSPEAVADLEAVLIASAETAGMPAAYRIALKPVAKDQIEPFGFRDGISQPVIRGTYKGQRNADPIHIVAPGEFILGYPDNRDNMPPGPTLPATSDPFALLPLVDGGNDFARTVVEAPRDLGCNGSFLVVRELEQDVAGFAAYCQGQRDHLRQAERLGDPYPLDDDTLGTEFIAAKLVGRWKDGSPLVRHPYEPRSSGRAHRRRQGATPADQPHPTMRATTNPQDAAAIERPPRPSDNDFLFGTEDPEAMRCPFGAHIRRANPRDSLDPGSKDQIDISNRHRIMRVGRQYQPGEGRDPGLLFMCLNGDIERQFEFLQQTWLGSPSFHGLSREKDPLVGDGAAGASGFTIPTRDGPVRLNPLPRFVTTRGGGYFFVPGRRLIAFLAAAGQA